MKIPVLSLPRSLEELVTVPRKILILFLSFYIIYPAVFLIIITFSIGFYSFLSISTIVLLLCIPIIPSSTAAFLYLNHKLKKTLIAVVENREEDVGDKTQHFLNSFAFYSSLAIFAGFVIGTFLAIFMAWYRGIVESVELMMFLLVLGEVPALIVSLIMYYYSKVALYPLVTIMSYRPLSVFYKLYIPIFSILLLLLNVTNLSIYKVVDREIHDYQSELMHETTEKARLAIESFFSRSLTDVKAHSESEILQEMDFDKVGPWLQRLHTTRHPSVELYLVSDLQGNAVTSKGELLNISTRDYFSRSLQEKKALITDCTVCSANGHDVIFAVTPIMRGSQMIGLMAASTPISMVRETIQSIEISDSACFMLFSKDRKIQFHTNETFRGKIIGTDITDTTEGYENIEQLPTLEENQQLRITFNGVRGLAYRTTLELFNSSLVLVRERSQYLTSINMILNRLTLTLIIVSLVSYLLLRFIARDFSRPLKSSLYLFRKTSSGDLTASSNLIIPDETGELLRYLQQLIAAFRKTISAIMDLSGKQKDSTQIMASTSQNLSFNAQEQAASVEQSTAALEETLSSIEQVATNTKDQNRAATDTYNSMESLKEQIKEIAVYTSDALEKAKISSSAVHQGNELMQKTIAAMDRIDTSTGSISEFVMLISDISDKVNLLALNAAIEAARAGEHGRGFAVVADEIAKLADQTSQSASKISELVNEGLNEVAQGKNYVDETSRSLTTIMENITETDRLVRYIAESSQTQTEESEKVLTDTRRVMDMSDQIQNATEEQATANKEIITTISRINEATQEISEGSNDIASFAKEMLEQMNDLDNHIQFFTVAKEESEKE